MLNIYKYHTNPRQLNHYRELAPVMKDVRADRLPEDTQNWPMAVSMNGALLSLIPRPQITRDLCLAAVQGDGWSLQYIPKELRDRDVCLAAVNQDGWALRYVPEKLRDREISLAAVRQGRWALTYVPKEIRQRYPEIEQAAGQ